jgi:hypothetical protein
MEGCPLIHIPARLTGGDVMVLVSFVKYEKDGRHG